MGLMMMMMMMKGRTDRNPFLIVEYVSRKTFVRMVQAYPSTQQTNLIRPQLIKSVVCFERLFPICIYAYKSSANMFRNYAHFKRSTSINIGFKPVDTRCMLGYIYTCLPLRFAVPCHALLCSTLPCFVYMPNQTKAVGFVVRACLFILEISQ